MIGKLLPLTTIKGIQSFLGHAGFYKRFTKEFLKISKLLCTSLEHNKPFNFDKSCSIAFEELKRRLVTTPIVITPEGTLPFKLLCDVNDYAIGAVLG